MLQCVTHGVGCLSSTFCNSLGIDKEVNERRISIGSMQSFQSGLPISLSLSLSETKRYENSTAIAVLIKLKKFRENYAPIMK